MVHVSCYNFYDIVAKKVGSIDEEVLDVVIGSHPKPGVDFERVIL